MEAEYTLPTTGWPYDPRVCDWQQFDAIDCTCGIAGSIMSNFDANIDKICIAGSMGMLAFLHESSLGKETRRRFWRYCDWWLPRDIDVFVCSDTGRIRVQELLRQVYGAQLTDNEHEHMPPHDYDDDDGENEMIEPDNSHVSRLQKRYILWSTYALLRNFYPNALPSDLCRPHSTHIISTERYQPNAYVDIFR